MALMLLLLLLLRRLAKLVGYLRRHTADGQLVFASAAGIKLAIVQAAQRVEAEQARAGATRHGRVVDAVGRIVQRVDVGQGALGIGEAGLIEQRHVLQSGLVGDVAGGFGAAWLGDCVERLVIWSIS